MALAVSGLASAVLSAADRGQRGEVAGVVAKGLASKRLRHRNPVLPCNAE